MKVLSSVLLAAISLPSLALAAWGYTDNGSSYVIGISSHPCDYRIAANDH